jgi:hypothetical protein
MNMRIILAAVLLCTAPWCGAQTPPAADPAGGLPMLKRQFEAAIKETQQRGREKFESAQQKYLDAIATLEADLQDAGQLQSLITLREEKKRFEQDNDIPKSAIVSEPEGLRQLQTASRTRLQADRRDQALQIVTLGQKYMRDLAALQKALVARSDEKAVADIRAEKDNLLDNNLVREALAMLRSVRSGGDVEVAAASDETAPAAGGVTAEVPKARFYTPGKEPVLASQALHPLHLIAPNAEQTANALSYQLAASSYSRAIEGDKKNFAVILRLTITAKGKDVPADSKLVVDYFSHGGGATSGYKKESTEIIAQPKLQRGMAIVMDTAGITEPVPPARQLKKTEKVEKEFYGVVLSLFNADGKLIYQQCSLPALVKECGVEQPVVKAAGG